MMKFLKPFLIFVVMYHLFVTVVRYGMLGWAYPEIPALGRDAIWLLFFAIILIANFRRINSYIRTWKRPRITLLIILTFSVGVSLLKGKWVYDIFVGIKYGLLYLFIFLSSTFIGRIWNKKDSDIQHSTFNIQHLKLNHKSKTQILITNFWNLEFNNLEFYE